ncbi:Poly [ADP-ribose] polymerase 2, partial [Armadillidium vulgare]
MLNQTNIGNNNNKFYVIQIGKEKSKESLGFTSVRILQKLKMPLTSLRKSLKKRRRMSQESEDEDEDEKEDEVDSKSSLLKIPKKVDLPSKLDRRTQLMIKLIFNDDMFRDQMENMNLDVRKMPLGKLSKTQILKGLNILLELEKEIKKSNVSLKMKLPYFLSNSLSFSLIIFTFKKL